MKKEYQDKFIQQTNEVTDILSAMNTYLNRHKILINKLTSHNLPPSFLEEYGEFLIDWGNCIQKFAIKNKERDMILHKILGLEDDD
jgi:hypothetical protein